MPLEDSDIERIGDKIELSMLKAMNRHKEEDHAPLLRKLGRLDGKIKWGMGLAAGLSAGATHGLHKLFDAFTGGK